MPRRGKTKWTIMVYLAGDNDLTSHCVSVLQQMEAVKYRDDVCVLACFEASTPWPKGSRYVVVNCKHRKIKKVFDWELHNDLIAPSGGRSSSFCRTSKNGHPQSIPRTTVAEGLRRFLNFSIKHHSQSERFMLVLFGHGPIVAGKTFLASDNPGSFLRLEDLQDVLKEHFGDDKRRLSILAFQNCVMNGIETAYEVRNHADYMIGSQGLVLATGWPYDKMIHSIVERPYAATKTITRKLLKVCARSMLDFTIMDRSSEQSACNLAALRDTKTARTAVRRLSTALIKALAFKLDDRKRQLVYPQIADVVRLARLEAQSYWSETFVDLYDFCERLIVKCSDVAKTENLLLQQLELNGTSTQKLVNSELLRMTKHVIRCSIRVLQEIRELVPSTHTYYIGPELQYSHGISIYFPWTLPVAPYFSKPSRDQKEFELQTAFDTYSKYSFVRDSGWADFLNAFFRATLRNMRRGNRTFSLKNNLSTLEDGLIDEQNEVFHGAVLSSDLQKSSPDTARVNDDVTLTIKNYPRRNYLSPVDCPRKIAVAKSVEPGSRGFKDPKSPPVSSLGWNFPTLVTEVIRKPKHHHRKKKVVPPPATNGRPAPRTNHKGIETKALEKALASKALAAAASR